MNYLDTVESIKKVALYTRVSTDQQVEKFSLPAQEKLMSELAGKHGWEIVKLYRDAGFSGAWIERRPAFSALIQEANQKRFQAVLVTDFDRLTRPDNLKDLGRIQEVFIANDIKIVTLSDVIDLGNDDQWFLSSLLGIVAAKEKRKIIARMKRGIEAKKEQGYFYGGIPPSGYRWDDGKLVLRETREVVVSKKKGTRYTLYDRRTVNELFNLYLHQDQSIKSICKLYKMHFHSLTAILDRAWFYAGFVLKTRDREAWKKRKRNPQEPLVRGNHPAIISEDDAQRVLQKRQGIYVAYGKTREKFPSAGLVRCGTCGEAMYVYRSLKRRAGRPEVVRNYYVCRTRHGAQRWIAKQRNEILTRCTAKFVRADQVERAVWNSLEQFLTSPAVVLEQAGSTDHQLALVEREIEDVERARQDFARRRSNLMDLYEFGRFPLAELDQRMRTLEEEEAKVERQREASLKKINAYAERQVDPEKVYRILSQVEEVIRFAEPEHRREIVRLLCRKITVQADRRIEIMAALPQEATLQKLSVVITPAGERGDYLSGLQRDAVVRQ
jgi:site-specific DNA recombinase